MVIPCKATYAKILCAFETYSEKWSWADQVRLLDTLFSPDHFLYGVSHQDLLNDLFRNEWTPIHYRFNAQKRMFLYRPDWWNDSVPKVIHYIGIRFFVCQMSL